MAQDPANGGETGTGVRGSSGNSSSGSAAANACCEDPFFVLTICFRNLNVSPQLLPQGMLQSTAGAGIVQTLHGYWMSYSRLPATHAGDRVFFYRMVYRRRREPLIMSEAASTEEAEPDGVHFGISTVAAVECEERRLMATEANQQRFNVRCVLM